jgi:hypothetical protein
MTNRSPRNDPKRIWQNQNPEEPMMSLQEIRAKVRQLETTRLVILGSGFLGWLGFATFFGVLVARNYEQGQPLGAAFVGCFALISIYMAYICGRGLVSKTLVPDAGRKTAIESLRAFYQWKRGMNLRILVVYGAMFFVLLPVGAVLIWLQQPVFPTMYAVLLGGAYLWLATLTYFSCKWLAHRLRTEFDSVEALEKDDGNAS